MLEPLVNFISGVGHLAYLLVFLGVLLESGVFLGFLVPGETLVLLGGFLAAQGTLNLWWLMAGVCASAIIGDSIGFEIGKHLGLDWLAHRGRHVGLTAARLGKAQNFFCLHGGKAVFLGRFWAFLRALTPFIAGASGLRYRRFLLYNALGGLCWGAGFTLLGYAAGASWQLLQHWVGRAALVAGGLLLLILLLAWLWQWASGHEQTVRRWARLWARWWRTRRWVRVVRRRFAPQLAFLRARLSPGGAFGLHLTVGLVLIVGTLWIFAAIAEDVVTHDPLTLVDVGVANWLHAHTHPALTRAMLALTHLGNPAMCLALAAGVALLLAIRRAWYRLLTLALALGVGESLNILLKHLFHRPRPIFPHPLLTLHSASFPAGHANASLLLYGLLAIFLMRDLAAWRWRVLVALLATLLIFIVSFSRLYLGVHYLSDVLAAWAEAAAWLTICLTAVRSLQQARRQRAPSAAATNQTKT